MGYPKGSHIRLDGKRNNNVFHRGFRRNMKEIAESVLQQRLVKKKLKD